MRCVSIFGTFIGVLSLASAAAAPETVMPFDERLFEPTTQVDPAFIPDALSDADASRYAQIFDVQDAGDWQTANALIQDLENDILMGHVKYQRYMHPTDYRSSYVELKNWMANYADHPNANKIYRLATRRRPQNYRAPVRPEPRKWRQQETAIEHPAFEALNQSYSKRRRVAQIERYVRSLLRKERPTQALNYVNSTRIRRDLATIQYDRLRARIAASYFFEHVDDKAYRVAADAIASSGDSVPIASWTAGLAAWRLGDIEAATDHFEPAGASEYLSSWISSAAAYWAARGALTTGQANRVTSNLERAAEFPLTFYGQIALKQLGRSFALEDSPPDVDENAFENLTAERHGVLRAVALAEAGQPARAEEEMRRAHGALDPSFDHVLFATARLMNLPTAQMEIASGVADPKLQAGLYPLPGYEPIDGFSVDRALIYAFMRQESKFIPTATSYVGARGLMQLMPRTASFISGDRSLHRYRSGRAKLYNPEFNLSLGQKYLHHLMDTDYVGADLFKITIAYNGGPGNLRKWQREMRVKDDPLLFIESIPNFETRNFIERVLTNLWIYRSRLGEPTPTLDAVAAGGWPMYRSLETFTDPLETAETRENVMVWPAAKPAAALE